MATTPAQIRLGVDQTGLASGTYSARIQISDGQGRPLGASMPVSVQVTTGPAHLNISPAVVKFAGSISQGSLQEEILIRNDGPGPTPR